MTLSGATVLIVDDEPILRMTFSVLLQQCGALVHTAANGAEALQVLSREHIDVMLTDMQMPIMDGMTLLRSVPEDARVPAILFVSAVHAENRAELHQLRVVETITKPIHPAALTAVLEKVLEDL